MTHVESVECRRLCASTIDPTFGNSGVKLPVGNYHFDNILATHGAVYVSAFDADRRREVVFKYDEDGVADTAWGLGGYIVPKVYARPVADLAFYPLLVMSYDARTKGLVVGYGDFDRVILERRDRSGAVDTTWGQAGRYSYREPKRFFTLDTLVPLAKKQVLLVARRQGLEAVDDQIIRPDETPVGHYLQPIPGGVDDVMLARTDRLGRTDKTFNTGRPLAVAAGSLTYRDAVRQGYAVLTGRKFSDTPTFGDLQVRDDGSVRVVSTRMTTSTVITQVDEGGPETTRYDSNRVVASVESTVVSATGTVVPEESQTYVLKRYREYVGAQPSNAYRPAAAFATGDDGVAVLANSPEGTPLLRLSPGYRSTPVDVLPRGLEDSIREIEFATRAPNGDVFVQAWSGFNLKLRPDLTVDPDYTSFLISFISTLDDTGRLLTIGGGKGKLARVI